MADTANVLEEGIERFRTVVDDFRKDLEGRGKKLEKRWQRRSRELERKARKRVDEIGTELREWPVMERVEGLWGQATDRIEDGVNQVFDRLSVATKRDLARVDRKLAQLSRKLRAIEEGRA